MLLIEFFPNLIWIFLDQILN